MEADRLHQMAYADRRSGQSNCKALQSRRAGDLRHLRQASVSGVSERGAVPGPFRQSRRDAGRQGRPHRMFRQAGAASRRCRGSGDSRTRPAGLALGWLTRMARQPAADPDQLLCEVKKVYAWLQELRGRGGRKVTAETLRVSETAGQQAHVRAGPLRAQHRHLRASPRSPSPSRRTLDPSGRGGLRWTEVPSLRALPRVVRRLARCEQTRSQVLLGAVPREVLSQPEGRGPGAEAGGHEAAPDREEARDGHGHRARMVGGEAQQATPAPLAPRAVPTSARSDRGPWPSQAAQSICSPPRPIRLPA